MAFSHPDRAGDFEENLFRDPQLLVNVSFMNSRFDFSEYYPDEWFLQENDLLLTRKPSMKDASRKYLSRGIAAEIQGSFLFFYLGGGLVFSGPDKRIDYGSGKEWYSNDTTRLIAQIRRGSYWKAGLNLHFRRWLLFAGIRGYGGIRSSDISSENIRTRQTKILTGTGSTVFNNFIEFGIKYQNFTIGFEKALNIDFSGAVCESIFLGYNLFNLRNYNEKRIPR